MKMSKGFSMFELTFVVAILLVLGVIAIPNMITVISTARLHAGVTSMSGLLQNCRMSAIKLNKTLTTRFETEGTATLVGFVKEAQDTSARKSTDLQAEWEAPVVIMTTPDGDGAPSVISTTVLGFTPEDSFPSFNSRGLPCAFDGDDGSCDHHGFVYYFEDTSRKGSQGWAALSISPAGRIKKWFWNGTDWTD